MIFESHGVERHLLVVQMALSSSPEMRIELGSDHRPFESSLVSDECPAVGIHQYTCSRSDENDRKYLEGFDVYLKK
jgi:hypothetical protein